MKRDNRDLHEIWGGLGSWMWWNNRALLHILHNRGFPFMIFPWRESDDVQCEWVRTVNISASFVIRALSKMSFSLNSSEIIATFMSLSGWDLPVTWEPNTISRNFWRPCSFRRSLKKILPHSVLAFQPFDNLLSCRRSIDLHHSVLFTMY